MTNPDQWGRVRLPPAGTSGRAGTGREQILITDRSWWALIIVRGTIFVGGIGLSLAATLVLPYGGLVDPVFMLAQLGLAPIAVLFWVMASLTKAGDRWTIAYICIWTTEVFVVWIGSTVFW